MKEFLVAIRFWRGVVSARRVTMLVTILLSALSVGLLAASILAQEKPDFSGKWTLVQRTQPQDNGGDRRGFGGRDGIFGGGHGGFGGRQGGHGGSGLAQ